MAFSILVAWFAVSFALGPIVGRNLSRCAAAMEDNSTA
jgi:hypothetical protein